MSVCLPPALQGEIELPHTVEDVRAEKARRSLETYVREAWNTVEPETSYHSNWHIGAVCYYLEAITAGEIQNLLINVPPGFMKSLLVSVFWPTWEWGPKRMPQLRYIAASNGRELAVRDTLRARRLILSDWYQAHYGDSFSLLADQNRKMRFDNDRGGSRLALSVGSGTGERANRVIFDDPHELDDADYPEQLDSAVEYNNVTLDSRLANRETDSRVVVQQRVAVNDVSGDILRKMEQGGKHYEVVCLPMRHDPAYQAVVSARNKLPQQDPRDKTGELIDPERYSEKSVEQDDITYGDRAPAVLDQKPRASGNTIYKSDDFERFDLRDLAHRHAAYGHYVFFDTAYEETDSSAYTAWVVMHLSSDYRLKPCEVGMKRLAFPDLEEKVEEVALRWNGDGKLKEVVIERAASGRSALQSLGMASQSWLAQHIKGFNPGQKSKVVRAREASLWTRKGCVLLPIPESAEWVHDFTEEIFEFPNTQYKDRTDAFTMGILYMRHFLADGLRFRGVRSIPDQDAA